VGLTVGVFWSRNHYKGLVAERDQLKTRVGELEAELAGFHKQRAEKEKLASTTEQNLKATQAELEQLRQQRQDAERRLELVKELTAKFQKMIDTGKLKIAVRHGRMIVKLPAEVLFPSGSAELSPGGKATLAEVASVLKTDPTRKLMVAGHTDNQPIADSQYRSNWALSADRAVTVTEFLVANGIRPNNLVAAGYAEHDPVSENRTGPGRQDNRRIELVIQPPALQELPGLVENVSAALSAAPSAAPPSVSPPGAPASAAAR